MITCDHFSFLISDFLGQLEFMRIEFIKYFLVVFRTKEGRVIYKNNQTKKKDMPFLVFLLTLSCPKSLSCPIGTFMPIFKKSMILLYISVIITVYINRLHILTRL